MLNLSLLNSSRLSFGTFPDRRAYRANGPTNMSGAPRPECDEYHEVVCPSKSAQPQEKPSDPARPAENPRVSPRA